MHNLVAKVLFRVSIQAIYLQQKFWNKSILAEQPVVASINI